MVATERMVVELAFAPEPLVRRRSGRATPRSAVAGVWAGLVGLAVIVLLTATPAAGPAAPGAGAPCLLCEPGLRYDARTFAIPREGPQRMGSP